MEKQQVNPNYVLEELFERVKDLTKEDVIKNAYIKQLEKQIEDMSKQITELTSSIANQQKQ